MKCVFSLCLIAIAVTVATSRAIAQAPAMTKGISVQMASTTGAVAFPDADKGDAWIITVTADGRLYFAAKPVPPDSLAREMKAAPRNGAGHLFIKADARAPFSAVEQALDAAHSNSFDTAVLLTEQSETSDGTNVPPRGLEVRLSVPASPATVVQLQHTSRQSTHLRINNQDLPWSQLSVLQSVVQQQQAKQKSKQIVVQADGILPFDDVVKVIDLGRSTGAEVAVSLASM